MSQILKLLRIFFMFFCCLSRTLAQQCDSQSWRNYECRELSSLQDLSLSTLQPENWLSLSIRNDQKELTIGGAQSAHQFSNLMELDLSRVPRLKLESQGFSVFSRLRHLNLSGCNLEHLNSSHFAPDSSLQQLDASYNELTVLTKDLLDPLRKLMYANFAHNQLVQCEVTHMPLLQNLQLDFNELSNISFGKCPSLRHLSVNDNLLAQLEADIFQGLPALEKLHLSGNSLNSIPPDAFQPLMQLNLLNLSRNSLGALHPNVFGSTAERIALVHIDLRQNNIRLLYDNQFKALNRLQVLDLSENSLASLSPSNFVGLAALRKLYLRSNDVIEIKPNTFSGLDDLDTLDLSHNSIEYLDEHIFGSNTLTRMRKLYLATNNLKRLHALAFSSLPFLEYLSLAYNELQSLDVRMFSPMRRLQKLHLGHNLIEEIGTDVVESWSSVQELLFDHNRLSYLVDGNNTFPFLRRVSIEGNPWQCACLKDLEEWLADRKITYVRAGSSYFKGEKPLCVVTPVDICVQNLRAVRVHGIAATFDEALSQSGQSKDIEED